MSALNYLYKELNWLVNKIETSSRGKISKRDLLIYSLIIIFILSVRFGGVIGAFTFVLAVATIWNIKVTRDLLKQSKVSSLTDMIIRSLDIEREVVSQQEATYFRYYDNNPGKLFKDLAEAFGEVDEKFSKTYLRIMEKFQKASRKKRANK